MRILFYGDAAWAANTLHLLVEKGHEVAGVVLRVNPSDELLAVAATELGLTIMQPQQVNAPEFVQKVQALAPEMNLSVSYNQILRAPILATAPKGFINLHAGKLPYYRGCSVVNWALINGEPEIGLTVHFVDEGVDTGDIIVQKILPLDWTDDYAQAMDKVVAQVPHVVTEAMDLLVSGNFQVHRQTLEEGTYFPRRGPGDEWVDWNAASAVIHNHIRAISRPAPGARAFCRGEEIIIWKAFFDPAWPIYQANPGQVVGVRPGRGVMVKTGDSHILVQEIQRPGQPPSIPRWSVGTRLQGQREMRLHEIERRMAGLEELAAQGGPERK